MLRQVSASVFMEMTSKDSVAYRVQGDWSIDSSWLDTARKGANIRKPALSRPAGHLSGQTSKEGGLDGTT